MNDQNPNSGAALSPPESWILTSLFESPKHGYAIAKQVGELSEGQVRLSAATLYGNIHRMLEAGLIERDGDGEHEVEPGLRRKRYRVSGLGARAIKEHARLQQKVAQLIPGLSGSTG